MTASNCHRCHAELPAHDDGTLLYCSHCGAPQVYLSEELLDRLEAQSRVAEGVVQAPARDPRTLVWPAAMRIAALAAAIAGVLTLLAALLPPVLTLLLVCGWAVISPIVVLGIFRARMPEAPVTVGFGARLGLVTGLGIGVVMSVINAAGLVAMRRAHGLDDADRQWLAQLDIFKARAVQQSGNDALPFVNALAVPEFHAGMMLLGVAMLVAFLLVLTTAGGAFAGLLTARSKAGTETQ